MTMLSTPRTRFRLGAPDERVGNGSVHTAAAVLPRRRLAPMDIVIAGDQVQKFDGWSESLRDSGFHVVPVGTRLDSVLNAVNQRRPAALVVDLSDLTRTGLELAQQMAIRDEFLALPTLFLLPETAGARGPTAAAPAWDGMHNPFALAPDVHSAVESILFRCADFLLAPVTPYELAVRLSRLVREPAPAGNQTGRKATAGPVEIDERAHRATASGREVSLRKKEYDLLLFLIRNAGVVFTRDALLRWVWGPGFSGDPRTVDVHIRRLRSKLGDDAGAIIETVRRVGYRLSAASQPAEKSA